MVKFSVMYPNGDGAKFDLAYYLNTHIPKVKELLGAGLRGTNVDYGLGGGEAGSKAPYVAMAHLLFDSTEAFHATFDPRAPEILGDLPNFTNLQPLVQLSEVRL